MFGTNALIAVTWSSVRLIRVCAATNDPAHRPRAGSARNPTETQSQGSLQSAWLGIPPAIVTVSALILCRESSSDPAEYPTRQRRGWQTTNENQPKLSVGEEPTHGQQSCDGREAADPDAHEERHSSHVSHAGRGGALGTSQPLAVFTCCSFGHATCVGPAERRGSPMPRESCSI